MLLSLTVFMLLVAEIMPATSDSVPLIGNIFYQTNDFELYEAANNSKGEMHINMNERIMKAWSP